MLSTINRNKRELPRAKKYIYEKKYCAEYTLRYEAKYSEFSLGSFPWLLSHMCVNQKWERPCPGILWQVQWPPEPFPQSPGSRAEHHPISSWASSLIFLCPSTQMFKIIRTNHFVDMLAPLGGTKTALSPKHSSTSTA